MNSFQRTLTLPNIFITNGDPNGIGSEIILKAVSKNYYSRVLIIGSYFAFSYLNKVLNLNHSLLSISSIFNFNPNYLNILDVSYDSFTFSLGFKSLESAKSSILYLNYSIKLLKKFLFLSPTLITGPICKKSISTFLPSFTGHTDYLKKAWNLSHNTIMLMHHPELTVALVTHHIPLKKVPFTISKKKIIHTASLSIKFLSKKLKKKCLSIAICGLNPHAGENGILGYEEKTIIKPAIFQLKKLFPSCSINGPLSSDSAFFFRNKYDLFIAQYHDQGLIPFKTIAFQSGINITLGLPFLRVSVDHGTAFDIADKIIANPKSMNEAIKYAYL